MSGQLTHLLSLTLSHTHTQSVKSERSPLTRSVTHSINVNNALTQHRIHTCTHTHTHTHTNASHSNAHHSSDQLSDHSFDLVFDHFEQTEHTHSHTHTHAPTLPPTHTPHPLFIVHTVLFSMDTPITTVLVEHPLGHVQSLEVVLSLKNIEFEKVPELPKNLVRRCEATNVVRTDIQCHIYIPSYMHHRFTTYIYSGIDLSCKVIDPYKRTKAFSLSQPRASLSRTLVNKEHNNVTNKKLAA